MASEPFDKEDITAITRSLLSAVTYLEEAACRSSADKGLQDRLRELSGNVSEELLFLDMMAPKIVRPAAWRTR